MYRGTQQNNKTLGFKVSFDMVKQSDKEDCRNVTEALCWIRKIFVLSIRIVNL